MSWTNDLSKLKARSGPERAAVLEAFLWLGVMRLTLRLWPFRSIAVRMGLKQTGAAIAAQNPHIAETTRIGWAVKAAASRTPWPSTCLVQALAGMMMLSRRKMTGALYLGVAKDELAPEPIAAHSWLCSGESVLVGENGRESFKVISIFSNRFERGHQIHEAPQVFPQSSLPAEAANGSELCLSCGLCCSGALYSHAKIDPDEIDHARRLGLPVEPFSERFRFRLPCPLHRDDACSIYEARRPQVCYAYQCDLLKNYRIGTISRESGLRIVRRARDLQAAVVAKMPAGCSFNELSQMLARDWDSGSGPLGSIEMRQAHAGFFLALASMRLYLLKHFDKSKAGAERTNGPKDVLPRG